MRRTQNKALFVKKTALSLYYVQKKGWQGVNSGTVFTVSQLWQLIYSSHCKPYGSE